MKKMNKLFAFIFMVVVYMLNTNELSAQASANSTLNVVLSDVKSIKISPSQTNISLTFATGDDYTNGVTAPNLRHLEITSSSGYQVKVKASGVSLVNGANVIPVSTISIIPTISTGGSVEGVTVSTVSLASTTKQIVASTSGATQYFYDISYKAAGGTEYLNKAVGTYTTTVTYSIEPN